MRFFGYFVDIMTIVAFAPLALIGCENRPSAALPHGDSAEVAVGADAGATASSSSDGLTTHASFTCGDFVDCLERGNGGAACERRCAAAPATCANRSGDGDSSRLLSCLRHRGGIGCLRRHCGIAPTEVRCPRQRDCYRGGGGYACFSRECGHPIAEIIEARGSSRFRPLGAPGWEASPGVGTELYAGDLLRVPRGSFVGLRCYSTLRGWSAPEDDIPWSPAVVCPPLE
jgi:hypothetical protein